jgi:hypothetical protein
VANNYNKEQDEEFIKRAKEFIKRKPNSSRAKIAKYSGCDVTVLERLQDIGGFKLPKPMTSKQQRKLSNWGTILGGLSNK